MTWFTLSVTVLLEAINLTLILTQDYKLLLFFLFAITRNYWRQLGSLQLTRIWTILSFRQWWNGTRPGWGLCSFSYTHYFVLILLFYLNKKTLKMRISCWPCNKPTEENGLPQFLLTSSVVRHSSLLGWRCNTDAGLTALSLILL